MQRGFTIQSKVDGLMLDGLVVEPEEGVQRTALLQLSHGMSEYKERYLPFMEFMAEHGVVCVIHDHRGHGKSVKSEQDLGFMYGAGGAGLVEDLFQVTVWAKKEYPDLPFILMGHSMGSLVVRTYAKEHDRELDALIAAAGFRHSLPAWCVPKLTAAETVADGAAHGAVESSGQHFEAMSLQLEQLYHPLLADPVKNDIKTTNGVLLTGSNASGKSTFFKAVALNMILAQTIHTCCADHCQSSYWRVMTSMALRDDLGSGESYYIVEIHSLKRILDAVQSPGAPVLCFVDEVLRGTNTVERIAASTQILKSLHKPGVCCFAATHDVELTGLLEAEYDNYHFEEQIADGDISFPYLLMPGRATSRNAIRLLEMMGYSEEIIKKADDQAAEFLKTGVWKA